MKKLLYFLLVFVTIQACTPKATAPVTAAKNTTNSVLNTTNSTLANSLDSISYAYGLSIAKNFTDMQKSSGEKLFNDEKIRLGIQQGFNEKAQLTDSEMETLLRQHQTRLMESKRKADQMAGDRNKIAGQKFLEENKKKTGVYITESGLQYIIQKEGNGASPTAKDKVEVHYEGRLINGDVFDSSYKRGKPTSFGVNQVIPGWTEGLQLMKPGSKFTFFIPSNLAYGERGAGAKIGPHSTLIFDVELIQVK